MRIAILGAGESGRGAAILAATLKYEVLVSDSGRVSPEAQRELNTYNVPFEESGHTFEKLIKADLIVKSPGIPKSAKIVRDLRAFGKEIISEIEFAFSHCQGKVIAVTGSNGKTTTTMLIHHILNNAGIDAALCGNVGVSFARTVAVDPVHEWYVIEVSSFQLEDVDQFQPDIALLLNITPDHLDRYDGRMQLYAETKWRIARRMTANQYVVQDKTAESFRQALGLEIDAQTDLVRESLPGDEFPGHLQGVHDAFNATCAVTVVKRAGVEEKNAMRALESFEKPPHRMQLVAEIGGVRFMNDSKATNTDSVLMALRSVKTPIVWIAGGQNKGNDYSALMEFVEKKVHALICLGIDNEHLIEAFSSKVDGIEETTSMQQAVHLAASAAHPGDTVLLSPACASFDLFENYIDRGRQFIEAVKSLETEKMT